jgi:hypothetical protein
MQDVVPGAALVTAIIENGHGGFSLSGGVLKKVRIDFRCSRCGEGAVMKTIRRY